MTTALSQPLTLSTDELQALALRVGTYDLPTVLARRGTMNLELLVGIRRACGFCAADLGFGDERRRGPFWPTDSSSAFLDGDRITAENRQNRIGSYVTRTRKGLITFDHDTDSDSDAVDSDVRTDALALPSGSSRGGVGGARSAPSRVVGPPAKPSTKRARSGGRAQEMAHPNRHGDETSGSRGPRDMHAQHQDIDSDDWDMDDGYPDPIQRRMGGALGGSVGSEATPSEGDSDVDMAGTPPQSVADHNPLSSHGGDASSSDSEPHPGNRITSRRRRDIRSRPSTSIGHDDGPSDDSDSSDSEDGDVTSGSDYRPDGDH